jgi:thiol-disulfide isomerase/thioredoxin
MRPATIPRPSPELVVTQPSGAETRLSSFKGKVVAVEFLFVRSPHCLQLAQMLNRLNSELGGRGFQPMAVAFGPSADLGVLTSLVDHLKLTYPVGLTTSDQVDAYLGRAGKEILKIPQIVIVDRDGVIRATSGRQGDPALESASTLRPLIETLLRNPQALLAAADRKAATDFTLQDVRGVPVRLADYRGRVVLLNFWATWCGPCKTEIPWFQEFEAAYQDRGFTVLSVAMDESGRDAVKLYAGRQKKNYRILLGNQQVARRYGGIAALPETLLIDREGRIAAEHVGLVSKTRYEEEIGELLLNPAQ